MRTRLLLDVLSHPALAHRPPPLLLAVNKTDRGCAPAACRVADAALRNRVRSAGCHSVHFVRKRLEKEMCVRREPFVCAVCLTGVLRPPFRSEALRAARGTLADAGGSSSSSRGGGGVSRLAPGAPFSFDGAGLRVTCAGVSVAKDDLDAVRSFAAAA